MGYTSCGQGEFILRQGKDEKEAVKAAKEENFEIVKNNDGTFEIWFTCWKVYYAGKSLKKLMEFFNGTFEITGEENGDIWKLELKDGKAIIINSKMIWLEPKETDLDSNDWN